MIDSREEAFLEALSQYVIGDRPYYSRSEQKQEQRYNEQIDLENSEEAHKAVERIENIFYDPHKRQSRLRILETGSGAGGLSVALALRGHEVYGIEPDASGVEASTLRAKRYPNIHVSFQKGRGEELHFEDNFFDIVVSESVIEHVQNLEKTIREMYRVLKSDGIVYIEAPNYLWPHEVHYRIFFPPFMPRFLGRFYLRLRGKDADDLKTLNYVMPHRLRKSLGNAGFVYIVDRAYENHRKKILNPSSINNRKTIGRIIAMPFWGDAIGALLNFCLKQGLYPGIMMSAKK